MQHILFIGIDFEQYLRLKESFDEFICVYSISLSDGTKQYNQPQQFCIVVLNLSLILSDSGQEEILRSFRRARPTPIIVLCGNIEDSNIVRLLSAGADQVLALQTPDVVLAAYMHTLINRYTLLNHMDQDQSHQTDFRIGDFSIDLSRRQVHVKGKKVHLSGKEFDLLLFFAQNSDRVLSKEQILERVWQTDKDFHSGITKPVNRLRHKIEPNHSKPLYIRTVRGVGYQFVPSLVKSCDICHATVR